MDAVVGLEALGVTVDVTPARDGVAVLVVGRVVVLGAGVLGDDGVLGEDGALGEDGVLLLEFPAGDVVRAIAVLADKVDAAVFLVSSNFVFGAGCLETAVFAVVFAADLVATLLVMVPVVFGLIAGVFAVTGGLVVGIGAVLVLGVGRDGDFVGVVFVVVALAKGATLGVDEVEDPELGRLFNVTPAGRGT